ncbi:hypothetical protein HPB49_026508 [Dermacentor silvarum]|nr:hypothetical protein HPB49_026508 [Dermacentor silvarum]
MFRARKGNIGRRLAVANMAPPAKSVDELVQHISLHTRKPFLLDGCVSPFLTLYTAWLYLWTCVYGVSEYYEAGLIALACLGVVHILTCLFCHWSVHVRCLLSCSRVVLYVDSKILLQVPGEEEPSVWFLFQKTKYLYSFERKAFRGRVPHRDAPAPLPGVQGLRG